MSITHFCCLLLFCFFSILGGSKNSFYSSVYGFEGLNTSSLDLNLILSEFYEADSDEYEFNFCYANAFRLLLKLKNSGFNLNDVSVLYLYRTDSQNLKPQFARTPPIYQWVYSGYKSVQVPVRWNGEFSFHVVLLVESFVFDSDFGDDPNITDVKTYFEMMFSKNDLENLNIKTIPGQDYIKNYRGTYRNFRYADENRYLNYNYVSFLESF